MKKLFFLLSILFGLSTFVLIPYGMSINDHDLVFFAVVIGVAGFVLFLIVDALDTKQDLSKLKIKRKYERDF